MQFAPPHWSEAVFDICLLCICFMWKSTWKCGNFGHTIELKIAVNSSSASTLSRFFKIISSYFVLNSILEIHLVAVLPSREFDPMMIKVDNLASQQWRVIVTSLWHCWRLVIPGCSSWLKICSQNLFDKWSSDFLYGLPNECLNLDSKDLHWLDLLLYSKDIL